MSLVFSSSFFSWNLYLGFWAPSEPGRCILFGCVRGPLSTSCRHTSQRLLLRLIEDLRAIHVYFYFFMFFIFLHLYYKLIASRYHVFYGNIANYKERTLDKKRKLRVCGPTMSSANIQSCTKPNKLSASTSSSVKRGLNTMQIGNEDQIRS